MCAAAAAAAVGKEFAVCGGEESVFGIELGLVHERPSFIHLVEQSNEIKSLLGKQFGVVVGRNSTC